MPEIIKLGGVELTATQVLDLSQSAQVPEHRTERQFSVADHIILEPKEFSISVMLFKDSKELEALRKLYESKQLVRFESELEDLDDMVITSFDLSPAGVNAYKAEIRIKQIRRAELKTRVVKFEDPATSAEIETGEEPPGGDTAVSPKEISYQNKPQKEQGKNWLESLISWVGGLFA
jgi:hypothetical protein